MELIKDVGMKTVGNNVYYKKRYGLFKCKCGKEVERIMNHGKTVHNCGCDNSRLKAHRKTLNNSLF